MGLALLDDQASVGALGFNRDRDALPEGALGTAVGGVEGPCEAEGEGRAGGVDATRGRRRFHRHGGFSFGVVVGVSVGGFFLPPESILTRSTRTIHCRESFFR